MREIIMKRRYFFSSVDRQVALLLGAMLILFSVSIYFVSTRIYYRAILESLTGRVDNIQQSETRKSPLLWQQVMRSLTKIRIMRLQIHRDVQMNRCIRIR